MIHLQPLSLHNYQLCSLFSGHRSAVTCLVFDQAAVRLASGAKVIDDDVTVTMVSDKGFSLTG